MTPASDAPAAALPDGAALLRRPRLDELVGSWRLAFNAADDALTAAGRGGATASLAPSEIAPLRRHLVLERHETARAIASIAGLEHLQLHARVDAPRPTARSLGLPRDVHALVFDLDGVLTPSDELHAAAWSETFNELLHRRLEQSGERFGPFRPFDIRTDYPSHFHDRPRLDGIRAFLASRGISLPTGSPDDAPERETVYGLANRKSAALRRRLLQGGLTAFVGSSRYLVVAREAGLHTAVVSASANTAAILERAKLASLVDAEVDGTAIKRERLEPFPAPDLILDACEKLGCDPRVTAVYVTSGAGVTAARAAHAATIVGVDRKTDAASVPVGRRPDRPGPGGAPHGRSRLSLWSRGRVWGHESRAAAG